MGKKKKTASQSPPSRTRASATKLRGAAGVPYRVTKLKRVFKLGR
jgi:hypothetical protein